MALISPSRRLRRTPFSEGVEAAGVKAYSVYNRMLLPTVFRSVEEDYRHLKTAVQVWDVAVERQVELRGPDASRLMQMLTPRDLRGMMPGQCYYVPMVDETGGMLNDPVALKLSEDRWWISIADSDLLLWVKGLAYGYRLDVLVDEPDVSPLAVQGPLADDLMERVFGGGVRAIKFFRFGWFDFQGTSFVIARSGYSKQGGFEIYVEGTQNGMPLWNALMEAGKDLDVHAGCPNAIERIAIISRSIQLARMGCVVLAYDMLGNDSGTVGRLMNVRPVNLLDDKYRDRNGEFGSDGYLYHVIREGLWSPDGSNRMPAYGHAVDEQEGWAIVAYIRVLQAAFDAQGKAQVDVPATTSNTNGGDE